MWKKGMWFFCRQIGESVVKYSADAEKGGAGFGDVVKKCFYSGNGEDGPHILRKEQAEDGSKA